MEYINIFVNITIISNRDVLLNYSLKNNDSLILNHYLFC